MGFLLLLKFALLCIDFLAWPVIALAYPLFASIRAIETGSVYHLRKLVIYWTLFSIISLFEYAFVKIIEWIPFWPSIKLVVIFWLVIPRFHGAYYAYQSFVRPHFVVNLEEAINKLNKPKEEQLHGKESFLDLVEKYIKENGSESLDKLIATKREPKEHDISSQRSTHVIKPDEESVAAASKQLKEPDTQKDKEMLESPEKIASTEAKQVQVHHPRPISTLWVPKETTCAAATYKGILPSPKLSSGNRLPSPPPLKKVEPAQWTCPLCQVTTTCEKDLNVHLQGKKHKSMCESLKASKLNAKGTGSLSGNSNHNKAGDGSEQESCEIQNQGSSSNKQKPDVVEKYIKERGYDALGKLVANKMELKELADSRRENTQVVKSDEKNVSAGSKQLKEPDAAHKDIQMLETTEAKQVQMKRSRPLTTACWVPKEATCTAAKTTETIISPETSSENRQPSTPPLEKVEPAEWTCPLCQVTTTCEKNLNDHLQGKKHKSMYESLETSTLNAQVKPCQKPEEAVATQGSGNNKQKIDGSIEDDASSEQFKLWCNICNLKLLTEIDVASHLNGKRHLSNIKKMGS